MRSLVLRWAPIAAVGAAAGLACGSPLPSGGGPTDGSALTDASAAPSVIGLGDAATGGGEAGPASAPDPFSCPVGAADGCCPNAIVHGGADPDCPSLACGTLTKDPAIPLDSPVERTLAQVASAWTGTELVLAWARGVTTGGASLNDVTLQRRTPAGIVGVDHTVRLNGQPASTASAELVADRSGDLFYVWADGPSSAFQVARLAPTGAIAWSQPLDVSACGADGVAAAPRAFVDGARLLLGLGELTCVGSTWAPRVAAVDGLTGSATTLPSAMFDLRDGLQSKALGGAGFAFHPSASKLDVIYGRDSEGDVRRRTLDFAAGMAPSPVTFVSSDPTKKRAPYLAFDGSDYGVVTLECCRPDAAYVFRRYTQTWVPDGPVTALAAFDRSGYALEPSVLWTGDGYVVLVPYVTSDDPAVPPQPSQLMRRRARIVRLDAAGVVRETFEVDGANAVLLPRVAWAGGRLAVTWLRPSGTAGATNQPFLRWLSCN